MHKLILRKALVADVETIHAMLFKASEQALLLPRSRTQLYNHLRDFVIFAEKDAPHQIVGFCALSITWADMGEIRSLIVQEHYRKHGLGRTLVTSCLEEAKSLGLRRVFTLTYQTNFFARLGFIEISKEQLPQKVWADCIHCSRFPDCDEIAMELELPA